MFTEPAQPGAPSEAAVKDLRRKVHQALKSVTRDFENFQFNTIVSTLMELLNNLYKAREAGLAGSPAWEEALDIYLRMMAPVTPHIAEELWTEVMGKPYSVHTQPWPEVDEEAARDEEITLIIQVNGKLRDRIQVPVNISEEEARARALASEVVAAFIGGQIPKKVIVVPGRLVNIVL